MKTNLTKLLPILPILCGLLIGCVSQEETTSSQSQLSDNVDSENAPRTVIKSSNIHEAAKSGDLDAVKEAIKNGSNVNKRGEFQKTPLMIACENGHLEIVKFLIQQGADVNIKNDSGSTALFYAAEASKNNMEIVKLLLQKNVDVNARDSSGSTALMFFCFNGHTESVKLLLQKNANVNVNNYDGRTALFDASLKVANPAKMDTDSG